MNRTAREAEAQKRLLAELLNATRDEGRSLQELLDSDDPLKGAEAQRLRLYFTGEALVPSRDLDSEGLAIMAGDLPSVQSCHATRVARISAKDGLSVEEAKAKAAQEVYALRWGPTRIPVYNLLLLGTIFFEDRRARVLEVMRWLIDDAKVPVGGTDLSGSMAISHAISTRPSVDVEVAQILHDAGEDVNARNRYGCTPASEICMVNPGDSDRAAKALEFFLNHGGNIDAPDNDRVSPRSVLQQTAAAFTAARRGSLKKMLDLVKKEDDRRRKLGLHCCTFCGREPERLLACSKCKQVRYCAPPRNCQKGDWPLHKTRCASLANANVYLGVKLG